MKKVPGKHFWLLMTMTGALIFGAPALVSASEEITSTSTENSTADKSGEGQISKPKHLENAENSGEEIISDESPTDNTYGYYTIMGKATVSVDDMCSLYNSHGCTYPSEVLSS